MGYTTDFANVVVYATVARGAVPRLRLPMVRSGATASGRARCQTSVRLGRLVLGW